MHLPAADPDERNAIKRGRFAWLGPVMLLLTVGGLATPVESRGRYSDGEFVGSAAETNWGAVQVKILVRDGAVTDVQFLQYPSHRRRSLEISNWALPALRSEAIRAQSAQVDLVSQATLTAYGFRDSLASALGQALKPPV